MYDFIASEVQSLQVQLTVNRLPSGVAPESRGQRQHQQTPATQSAVVNHTKEFRQVFSVCGIAAFLISWRSRPTRLLQTGQYMVAAATSSPAPHFTTNRFACLGTTDDEQSDSQPFTEVQSRRVKHLITTATATAAAGIPSATILLINVVYIKLNHNQNT